MKRIFAALVVLALAATLGGKLLAVEEPAFSSVLKEGPYELRDYPALVVAEVDAAGAQKAAASAGFRLLAGYIFGANQGRRKIAMTAPVAQVPAATPTPGWTVRFTMPSGLALSNLPAPDDPRVRLRDAAPARYATVRFSGLAQPGDVAQQTGRLQTWMAQHRLTPAGPATLAQYDPPWTLWFLRRNEVMIPVAP